MSEKRLKFLVAVGFTERPKDLLEKGVEVARKYNARLYTIHVVAEMPKLTFYYDAYRLWEDFRDSAVAEAMDILKKYIAKMSEDYSDIEPVIEVGDPGVKIIEKSEEIDADLIILGHHVRGSLTHMLHQNCCEWIVRHSKKPVLVFNLEE